MPLSKARDRDRKRKGRARTRLDKLLHSPQTLKSVQPKLVRTLDADGNVIPEVT